MLMSLGWYIFETKTVPFETQSLTEEVSWAKAERLNNSNAYQFTGSGDIDRPDSETMVLQGRLFPGQLTGGDPELKKIAAMARGGKSWPLQMGDGSYLGRWIIEKIEKIFSHQLTDGTARKIEFTLTMHRDSEQNPNNFGDLPDSHNGTP